MKSGREILTMVQAVAAGAILIGFISSAGGAICCDSSQAASSSANETYLAVVQSTQVPEPCPILDRKLLAKAEPDECYHGIGNPPSPGPPCPEGIPKVNQTYVWGMTKSEEGDIWFASSANVTCMAMASSSFVNLTPREGANYVCEYGESQYSPPLLPAQGDWRPPKIYVYDTSKNKLIEKTSECLAVDDRIKTTMGIRSAGSLGKIVIFAGPCLPTGSAGINLFAFRSDTKEYLGSTTLATYADIRKWLVVDGVLYTAVRNTSGGGSVLRWVGNLITPFIFEEVGKLDSEGVELAEHEGRLFVTTWPEMMFPPLALAGLYMSPPIPPGGLRAIHADSWTKVWQVDEYEPDPLIAATYGGGALASFKGYLYWGTMHMPHVAESLHFAIFGEPEDPEKHKQAEKGTNRLTSLFRGRNFGTRSQEITLLYGEEKLWKYTPNLSNPGTYSGTWEEVANNMGGVKPLFGPSGFGNPGNYYTWSMAVFQDQLFVGTMEARISVSSNPAGGDLFRFIDSNSPARPESLNGLGNPNNNFRNMVATEDALYVGTATMSNLVPDPNKPHGGWELIKLTAKPPIPDVDPLPTLQAECGITLTPPTASRGGCAEEKITATTTSPLVYHEPGTYTVTWAYGYRGSAPFQTQQIIIQDSQPPIPTIDPLPEIIGKGTATLTPPTAIDNCVGTITATTTDPITYNIPGTYTVTWTYDDGHGHSVTQTQKVTVELAIDIQPGSCFNQLNMTNIRPLSVLVLGSRGFDVASIEPGSLKLGREGISASVAPIRQKYQDLATLPSGEKRGPYDCPDLGRDGYKDLILDFNAQEVIRVLQLREEKGKIIPLILSGNLKAEYGSKPVKGQDFVAVSSPWSMFFQGPSAITAGWRNWGELSQDLINSYLYDLHNFRLWFYGPFWPYKSIREEKPAPIGTR